MKPRSLFISSFIFLVLISFFNCKEEKTRQPAITETGYADSVYIKIGKTIALEAQSVLAQNLLNAISKGGSEYAVEFCNTQAIMLTDSMAHQLNTGIKRVSDKPRNQSNQARDYELEYMSIIRDKMKKGEKPEPIGKEVGSKMVGLYPIFTNAMCLQCHGNKGVDIQSATVGKIEQLYPADKATGYVNNELRGLWVIEMLKK